MSGPDVFGKDPYVSKTPVRGRVVAVLRGVSEHRGLFIEEYRSRAVVGHSVHELMVTDELVEASTTVDRVGLIAFIEVVDAGVILLDDHVLVAGVDVGSVAGFNDTHMPNHQNICLYGSLLDGAALGIELNAEVLISRE
jgi:hypothetical protein